MGNFIDQCLNKTNSQIIDVNLEGQHRITKVEQNHKLNAGNYKSNLNDEVQYGIMNIGQTCYINAALQLIWQIYNNDPDFLNKNKKDSQISQILINLFENIKKRQDYSSQVRNLLGLLNNHQTHTFQGGDSYIALITILFKINQEIKMKTQGSSGSKKSLTEFQKYFSIIYQKNRNHSTNIYQLKNCCQQQYYDYCLELRSFSKLKKLFSTSNQTIQQFPKYLIIKFHQKIKDQDQWQQIENEICFHQKYKYLINGYCTYYENHYTYSALSKSKGIWIQYNDEHQHKSHFDLKNALILLLIKQE